MNIENFGEIQNGKVEEIEKREINDFTGEYGKEAKRLADFIEELPDSLKKILPKIEIRSSGREIHNEEDMARIKKENPDFNPDISGGEYYGGKVTLFAKAFEVPISGHKELKEKIKDVKPKRILLHELGHRFYFYFLEHRLFTEEEWDRVREADGKDNNVSADYGVDLLKTFGFFHPRVRSEHFADSIKHFILNPEEFSKQFPNSYAFCKKIIESLSS